jgi:putative ABC transport system permease protein
MTQAKVSLRRLLHQPLYTVISVIGLGIGMAVCLLVLRYGVTELSFDRHHPAPERTYRLVLNEEPQVPSQVIDLTRAEVQGVERVARFTHPLHPLISQGERRLYQPVSVADEHLFQTLSFPFLHGDPHTALKEAFSMVVAARFARQYYDRVDVVGETILWDQGIPFQITGVVEIPATSHLRFAAVISYATSYADERWDAILRFPWRFRQGAYAVLAPGVQPESVLAQILDAVEQHIGLWAREEMVAANLRLQPVLDIRLHSQWPADVDMASTASMDRLILLVVIGGFVLLLACANFTNLATAQATRRAREVRLRKAIGASRWQLARQFLAETLVISLLATLLALVLAGLAVPAFSAFLGVELDLLASWGAALAVTAVGLGVGVLAGMYPAMVLAGYDPMRALSAAAPTTGHGGRVRRILVIGQFTIAAALIAATAVAQRQMEFVRETDLGFDREQVVLMRIGYPGVNEERDRLVQRLRKSPAILQASTVLEVPTSTITRIVDARMEGEEDPIRLQFAMGDPGFLELFGIALLAGQDNQEMAGDRTRTTFVLNETALRAFGFDDPMAAIGRRIDFLDQRSRNRHGHVVGVMEDVHFESLHRPILPMALTNHRRGAYMAARLQPIDIGLDQLQQVWDEMFPEWPLEYRFLDENFEAAYRQDERLGQALTAFATLAIIVACLGVYALAAFAAQQCTREIGIRKALGASVPGMSMLLMAEFVRLSFVAGVLAAPLAYLATSWWLESFSYRPEPDLLVYVESIAIVMSVALLSTGLQAIRAARSSPVDALRCE